MKRTLLTLIILAASLDINAQVVFKPGYVVDNEGVRKECLVKDYGWLHSPEKVVYKLSEEAKENEGAVKDISAFGVAGADFIRREVNVDLSPVSLDILSHNRMPEYEKRTVFLKVLHEGDVSLYEYNKERTLYFYDMGNGVVPLVYKQYMESTHGPIRTNASFREQVKQFPGAANLSRTKLENLDYTATDLLKLFDTEPKKVEKQKLGFAVLAGGGLSLFDFKTVKSSVKPFGYAGFEVEGFLPFGARRFSIALQPSVQFVQGDWYYEKYDGSKKENFIKVLDFSIPVVVRYNLYLNDKSRLFANALVGCDVPLSYDYYLYGKDYRFRVGFRAGVGIGYRYGHFRTELRYTDGSAHLSNFPWAMNDWMRLASLNVAYCF
ncbi:MAG: hypothetical protein J5495_02400 [Bacteroidales bacterium]|nr:hypothetical protein [Bacteroidales bacterium]